MQTLVMRVYVLLDFFKKQQTTSKTGQVPVLAPLSTGVTVCLAVLLSAGLGTRSPPAYICGTSSRQPAARWPPDLLPSYRHCKFHLQCTVSICSHSSRDITHIACDLGNFAVLLKFANTIVPSITFSDLTDEDMAKSGRVYSLTQAT